jgi:hypothetical protein
MVDKDLGSIQSSLFAMHTILNKPDFELFVPQDLRVDLNFKLNAIPKLLKERAAINADTSLTDEVKQQKLEENLEKITKAAEKFADLVQQNYAVFLASIRNDLSKASTQSKNVDKNYADEVIEKINSISNDILSNDVKEELKKQIENLKAEKLTIKGEKREDIENRENVSSYNLEKAVDTVNLTNKDEKGYSQTMLVRAITHRLQQINKELFDIKNTPKTDGAYPMDVAVKLQQLITEQAQLTKELMNVKRTNIQKLRDYRLNKVNNKLDKLEQKNERLKDNGKGFINRHRRKALEEKLAKLRGKQGTLVAKQRLSVLLQVERMAGKAEKKSGKEAYRSVKSQFFMEGRINDSIPKNVVMAAMPRTIKLTILEHQDELYQGYSR